MQFEDRINEKRQKESKKNGTNSIEKNVMLKGNIIEEFVEAFNAQENTVAVSAEKVLDFFVVEGDLVLICMGEGVNAPAGLVEPFFEGDRAANVIEMDNAALEHAAGGGIQGSGDALCGQCALSHAVPNNADYEQGDETDQKMRPDVFVRLDEHGSGVEVGLQYAERLLSIFHSPP